MEKYKYYCNLMNVMNMFGYGVPIMELRIFQVCSRLSQKVCHVVSILKKMSVHGYVNGCSSLFISLFKSCP